LNLIAYKYCYVFAYYNVFIFYRSLIPNYLRANFYAVGYYTFLVSFFNSSPISLYVICSLFVLSLALQVLLSVAPFLGFLFIVCFSHSIHPLIFFSIFFSPLYSSHLFLTGEWLPEQDSNLRSSRKLMLSKQSGHYVDY